jgi:hypothetical protein
MSAIISKDDYASLLRYYNKKFFKPQTITIDESREYTEEEMVDMIKRLPDGIRFPLPDSWYEKYNIERPQPMSFTEALHNSFRVMFTDAPIEVRQPAEGGVRELPTLMVDATTQTDPQPESEEKVESSD